MMCINSPAMVMSISQCYVCKQLVNIVVPHGKPGLAFINSQLFTGDEPRYP